MPVAGISLGTGSDLNDSLTLLGGTADVVAHTLVDAGTSSIALTTGTTAQNIYYTKLAKITDNVSTSTRGFNMAAQAESAAISNSGISGITRLTVNGGRIIDFQTPGTVLNIATGAGVDQVTINSLGSGFGTPINIDTGAGADSLTVAGSLAGLGSLSLKSAAINLNAASIATTLAQSYTGAVKVGSSMVLVGSNLSFNNTINASSAGIDLTLNTLGGGTTSLLGAVGNLTPFRSVVTNADGTTILKGNVNAAGGSINFGDALTLQSNSIISNSTGGVTLGGAVSGAFSATINASTAATIIGTLAGLTSLQVTAPSIALNSLSITTTGSQTYNGAVVVGANETLLGSQLKFNSTLNASAANIDLTLNTSGAGATSLLGNVGGTLPFKSLTTNVDGQTILKGNISGAASTILFNDPVNLQADIVLADSGLGSLTFASSFDGGFNVQLASAGTVTLAGRVGFTTPIGRTTGPAFDIVSTGLTLFAGSVKTAAHFNQRDTAGEVTFKEDVTITAAAADSVFSGNVVLDGLTVHTGRGITFGSDAADQVTLSTFEVTLDVPTTKIATINSQITGPRGLTKLGAGTLALKTAATYTGPTRISAGFITRSAADLLPDATSLIIDAGNTFSMQNLNETIAGINGGGNIDLGSATLAIASAGGLYDGVISGGGKLDLNAGLQVLTGANTYTGSTTINGGNLQLAGGKIGATTAAGLVTIGAGGKLSGTGVVNAAINGLAASAIMSGGDFSLGLATSAIGFVTAGAINVGQTGTLTLLDKDTATIQGNVTLDGGTLSVAQAFSMGTGQTLSGFGTIVASFGVMNLSGAKLQPTLVLNTPGFQLNAASTFSVAVGLSQIVTTGPVRLNGSQLVIGPAGSYTHVNGKQTVLIDNDGTDPIVGEFANFPQGQELNFGSEKFSRIYYRTNFPTTANDVVVKALEFAVTPTVTVVNGDGSDPNVRFVTNDRGNTIYVWASAQGSDINYVVYGPQGTPLGTVRTLTAADQGFYYPNIVAKPDGGYAVIGSSGGGTNYVFSLDANGNPNGNTSVFSASQNTTTEPYADSIDIAFSSDGSFILAWEESQFVSPFRSRIVAQRFNASGQALDATPKAVTQFVDQFTRPVRVLRDSVGDTYIAWRNIVGSRYDINVRRMMPDGTFIGTQPTILAQGIDFGSSSAPQLRINSSGKLVFAYSPTDASAGHPTSIIVKQLAADLTTITEQTLTVPYYSTISLGINRSGHFALAYTDYNANFVLQQKVIWFAPDGTKQYLISKNEPLNYGSTLAMADDGSVVLGGPGFDDHLFRTRAYGEPTDIIAGPLTTNLTSTLSFPYDLRFGASGPLRVRFLKSTDKVIDVTDQALTTLTFTDAADLTVGRHTKSLTVGSLAGQVPLPGNGLPATTVDYYILAMLDPDDDLFELDVDSTSSDNLASRFVHFNDAPVIASAVTPIAYTENAAGLPIAPTGTVVDVDAVQPGYTDFIGGTMTFTLATNGNVSDRLEILNHGTAAGQISFTGTKLFYGGIQMGTFTGGSGLTPLAVSFTTATATPAATQALLRAVTFRSLGELPSTLPRTLTISLNDGDGGTSSLFSQTINVVSVPDAPVIGAFDAAIAYTENAASLALDANSTVTDIDSADFNSGTLTATLVTNREAADVLSIKALGTGASNVAVSNNQVTVGGVAVGSFVGGTNNSPLVITFNANATPARIQFLVRAIAFNSTSENPGTGARTVQLILTDGDGGTSLAVSKSVTVKAINDAPVVGSVGPLVTYSAGDAPISVVTTASVSDIDSINFDTGKLTITISANTQSSDRLSIKSTGAGAGQLNTTADFKVRLGTVQIGTYSGGIGTTPLVVTFNANSTPAIAQKVLAAVQYSNTAVAPSLLQRTVRVTMTDGDGGTSAAVTQKINVNDDPVISGFGGPVSYTRGGAAKLITTTATVTDASANFNAGLLTFALTGSDGSDVLSIKTSATLTIASGNQMFLNGIKIGTFTGGTNNVSLVITLTSNANASRVTTLLKAIQFSSTTPVPLPPARTLQVTLTDGLGGVSAVISKLLNVL